MFLQILGSPLVAYSRILVGPFSSPGDREFLLSTFGHVGSPPRHLKVGKQNMGKCGKIWRKMWKLGDLQIWRRLMAGELKLLPFQGTPECRKKTTTPWSLFPQTSRWGFGDQVHQLKKTKKLRHDKDSEKVQEAMHGVLNISHPVCVESRFRSFILRHSSSSICQPSKVEGTTMKTSKNVSNNAELLPTCDKKAKNILHHGGTDAFRRMPWSPDVLPRLYDRLPWMPCTDVIRWKAHGFFAR